MNLGLGWLPDKEDARDQKLSDGERLAELPASVNLQQYVVDVMAQTGDMTNVPRGVGIPSCVANAVGQGIRVLHARDGAEEPSICSRNFLWWHSRNQHGDAKNLSGTYIRDCVKVANKLGRPAEGVWPYDYGNFARKPPPHVLMAAHDKRLMRYERIDRILDGRIEQVKTSLALQRPVVFGTTVAESFMSVRGDTIVHAPKSTEPMAGGHAMVYVGYDSESALVVNSWGRAWGNGGFCRMGWDYVTWSFTRDLWSLEWAE